jgi:phosphate transport system ATP-binding protein
MTGEEGLRVEGLTVKAFGREVLRGISLRVRPGEILGMIGPAGSGKTTLLRALNRLIDLDEGWEVSGEVFLNGSPIRGMDAVELRRKVGLVFSVPTPLPLSIYDNLAFGPRLAARPDARELRSRMESCLRSACLFDEVGDRLLEPASNLSGGQQQRLCLARALMTSPEVLLLDEPCSGLDPISTAQIEEALKALKEDMAVVLVTNNVKQASRTADWTAFLLLGELVELGPTAEVFTRPADKRTEDYVTGRFG